ncbi:MAG: S9 family peptidase [Acholeplasmataceae bacterium]|nr:S9 family peptidase [Acholeplasmataceae bacterium]
MEKIQLDSFLKYRFIQGMVSNPSQNKLAFLSARANLDKNQYDYDLYVFEEKARKLVGIKTSSTFIWENDDQLLFPYAKNKKEEGLKKEKKTLYYRYIIKTRKLEKAYEFPFPATIVKVLDDNTLLLSGALKREHHRLYLDDEDQRKAFLKAEEKDALYEEINEIPFYFNGQGFTANVRVQLFLYEIKSKKIEPIADPNFSKTIYKVSEDKKKIYYTGKTGNGVRSLTSDVFVYDIASKKTTTLYNKDVYSISNLYLLDDLIIVAATDMKAFGINENRSFYVLNDQNLSLLATYDQSIGNSMGSDVRLGGNTNDLMWKNQTYFTTTIDDHISLMSLNKKGDIKEVFAFQGSIDGIAIKDDAFFVVGLHQQKLQEIYQLDFENHRIKQKTRLNTNVLKQHYIAKPKEIIYKNKTHEVKGWVLYPKGYQKDKTYPAILDIHGGPKTIYSKVFYHEMQYWANEGYVVFFANPRGSDGKGNMFADIRGQYGIIDYEDLMNFTQFVLKKVPNINQERLFVTGGSYGGFMTNWIVGQTDMFKAAATQRSISNWLSFHGTSDIGFYFSKDQTAGHPIVDTEKLWQHSPLKHANKVTTPLLFIHSDQDYRCPIEQAMQFYTILKEFKLMTRLVWFKGENHELSRGGKPHARIKRLNEITKWFNQFLKLEQENIRD